MSRAILFIGLCASLCCASCSAKKEEEEGFKFSVTSPLRKDTLVIRDYVCQIRAIQHSEVRALEKGYLQTIFVDEGKFVRQGQLMFQIMPLMYKAELQKTEAEAKFAEIEYLNFRMNEKKDSLMKVNLLMANNLLFDQIGIVQTIEADFNNETGNIAFRATFPNPKGLLRHGETGNVEMTAPLKGALIIPQKCTFEILEKKYVFIVDKDKTIHQKEITIAAEMPDLYIIKEGLSESDKIVLEGIRKVKDNEKLEEFEYHDPKTVIPHLKVYVE